MAPSGRETTQVLDWAREMRSLGVRRGDRVGALIGGVVAQTELLAAAGLIGATLIVIDPRADARELRRVVDGEHLRLLFTDATGADGADLRARLHEAIDGLAHASDPTHLHLDAAPELRAIVVIGGHGSPGMLTRGTLRVLAADVPSVLTTASS